MPDRRLPGFAAVGSVGFLVDAGVLTGLMTGLDWHHYPARALSFALAVTVTWYLNRRWVFGRGKVKVSRREYLSYFITQAIGATINLLVFVAAIELFDRLVEVPVVPLAMGSAVALIFNFTVSRRFVFAERSTERGSL